MSFLALQRFLLQRMPAQHRRTGLVGGVAGLVLGGAQDVAPESGALLAAP